MFYLSKQSPKNSVVEACQATLFLLTVIFTSSYEAHAHDKATYLGNSAILVETGEHKILFDPFFHNGFSIYQLVTAALRNAMMQGAAPYNNIDAIVISHAHEDHFSAHDVHTYMKRFPATLLFAPKQAVDHMMSLQYFPQLATRIHSFSLAFNADTETRTVGGLKVMATRIPHAGWPGRQDIENLVFRVFTNGGKSAMHMGDADPSTAHYSPYKKDFAQHKVDINFPPYWFFMSAEGRDILHDIIQAEQNVGVHVPKSAPTYLKNLKMPFFHTPEESKKIE